MLQPAVSGAALGLLLEGEALRAASRTHKDEGDRRDTAPHKGMLHRDPHWQLLTDRGVTGHGQGEDSHHVDTR